MGSRSAEDAQRNAQTAHQRAAKGHEDAAEQAYAEGDRKAGDEERALGREEREAAGIAGQRAQLYREPNRSRAAEGAGEFGDEVDVEPDTIGPSDPDG